MPLCNTCNTEKPTEAFPRNGKDPVGNIKRRADCTVCYNIKRRIDKRKHTKFVNNTKHRTGEQDTYTLQDWKDALIAFGGCCAYCGRPESRRHKLTREHIIPVDSGGKTVRRNIVPACGSCNSSKSNNSFEQWYSKYKKYSVDRKARIIVWRG